MSDAGQDIQKVQFLIYFYSIDLHLKNLGLTYILVHKFEFQRKAFWLDKKRCVNTFEKKKSSPNSLHCGGKNEILFINFTVSFPFFFLFETGICLLNPVLTIFKNF